MSKQKVICVFGSGGPQPSSADYENARLMGQLLAEAGFTVQTGGYGGIMAAASQGANEAGGHVIGITCTTIEQFRQASPNSWLKEVIKKETLQERLLYLVNNCDGAIVMPGGIGTLSELSLIWSLVQTDEIAPCPLITVGELWQHSLAAFIDNNYVRPIHQNLLTITQTPNEAITKLLEYF